MARTGNVITTTIKNTVRAPRIRKVSLVDKIADLLLHGVAEGFQAVRHAGLPVWHQRRRILRQHAVALDHPPAVLAGLIDDAVGMQRVAPTIDQLQEPCARCLGDGAGCIQQRRRETGRLPGR